MVFVLKKLTVLSFLILFLAVSSVSASDIDLNDISEDIGSSNQYIGLDESLNSLDINNKMEYSDLSESGDTGINNLNSDDSTQEGGESKTETLITANPITFNYASPVAMNISLTDLNGLYLSNKTISVFINENIYNLTTNDSGIAVFNFISSSGTYNLNISFDGDENYSSSSADSSISITKSSTKINLADTRGYLTVSNYISATLLDSKGHTLKNKNIIIRVNGTVYNATTNAYGVVKIKVANKVGTFNVKVSFLGDKNYTSSSKTAKLVISKMKVNLKAPSVVAYMTGTPYLTINLTNVYGNPLSNKKVVVKTSKKSFTLTTNSNGIAKLKFKNKIASYNCKVLFKATSNFYGSSVSSKVTVKKMPTKIKAPAVTVKSTAYGKVVVSLKNHYNHALKNKKLTVRVSELKKTYTFKTNSTGEFVFKFNGPRSYNLVINYKGSSNYAASSLKTKITVKAVKYKLNDIVGAAGKLASYVGKNKKLPENIVYNRNNFTVSQLSYLMAVAVKNINGKNYNNITLIAIPKTYTSSGEIYDTVYKNNFVSIAKKVVGSSYNFKNKAYVTYSFYKVPYKVYTGAFSRILDFYKSNKRLPNYALFTNSEFVKVQNSTKYTFYLTTDNIAGKRADLKMLKSLAKTLKAKGYNAVIVGIGPDIHNLAYKFGCTGNNSVLLACFGGVDVGCIEEWAGDLGSNSQAFLKNYDGAHVLGLWYTRPYGASASLHSKIKRAWDADYGFTLSNPAKYMTKHKISYIQTGTVARACELLKAGKMGGPKLIK